MFSAITTNPENALVVRCLDINATMNCVSNETNRIAWTYDGNTVINSPCAQTTQVFLPYDSDDSTDEDCGIVAMLEEARADDNILSISGPYGCTDQNNAGVTETSMVVVLGTLCRFSDIVQKVIL